MYLKAMESINDEWREVYMYIFKFVENIFFLSDRNWIKTMIYATKNVTATQFMKARATIKIKKGFSVLGSLVLQN